MINLMASSNQAPHHKINHMSFVLSRSARVNHCRCSQSGCLHFRCDDSTAKKEAVELDVDNITGELAKHLNSSRRRRMSNYTTNDVKLYAVIDNGVID